MAVPRLSFGGMRILRQFLMMSRVLQAGVDLGRAANVPPGTLYPLLDRLVVAGWLASRWEEGDPGALARPLKRFYRLTPLGVRKARAALDAVRI